MEFDIWRSQVTEFDFVREPMRELAGFRGILRDASGSGGIGLYCFRLTILSLREHASPFFPARTLRHLRGEILVNISC
jgi:hypothetical protein